MRRTARRLIAIAAIATIGLAASPVISATHVAGSIYGGGPLDQHVQYVAGSIYGGGPLDQIATRPGA